MNERDENLANELEQCLKATSSQNQRKEAFAKLCTLYAEDLGADAIKWARARSLPQPESDGVAAFSSAFILLAKNIALLDFNEKPLLYQFKGKIWSELGHRKSRRFLYSDRNRPIEEERDNPVDPHSQPETLLVAKAQLHQLAGTPAKQRLLRAAQLQKEGYTWEESAQEVGWKGSAESLRVSFAKLARQIRENSRD